MEYPDGSVTSSAYDDAGNVISETLADGSTFRYDYYYKNGWLHTVTDAKGNVTKYSYDARGNLIHTERPNGTEEICTFNEAGLLVSQKDVCGEEVLTEYTYSYDDNGNVTTIEGTETMETEEGISRLSSVLTSTRTKWESDEVSEPRIRIFGKGLFASKMETFVFYKLYLSYICCKKTSFSSSLIRCISPLFCIC